MIVTTAMPKDVSHFECREGIWITTPALALPLAAALRLQLIEVAGARRAMEGRHEKIEVMYDYISGPEFQAKVRAIIEGFQTMQEELEAEKRVMQSVWKKRGKQIERVTVQAIAMYGDLQGIIGTAMPKIENLELAALDNQSEDDGDPHFRYLQDIPADEEHGHANTPAHATPKRKK